MLDQVPWTFRYPNAALALLFLGFVVFFSAVWVGLIHRRLRRRSRAELRFFDEPIPDTRQPNDGELVVVRGRLVGIQGHNPFPVGAELVAARGFEPVHLQLGLCIERSKDRVTLVGPFRVLVGSRENPDGSGFRLLRAGDEVVVSGRWSVQGTQTLTYRDVVVKSALVPSGDELEIAFVGTPLAIGLGEMAIAKGLAWGAVFWAAAMSGGAYVALEAARVVNSELLMLRMISFVHTSPFLRSNAQSFLRNHASSVNPRDFETAEKWAAIESFIDPNHECLNTLDNLRQTGRIEAEAKLGPGCGGQSSKRRAADALMLLGEFDKAAETLRDAPPPANSIKGVPDAALDILIAVVTKDWSQAAKLVRIHGHPALAPPEEDCLALGLEARGGSFLSRDKLKSKAKTNLTCAVLEADLLEKSQRLAFVSQISQEMLDDGHKYLGEKRIIHRLQAESDLRQISVAYIEPNPRRMFGLSSNPRMFDSMPAIDQSALQTFGVINNHEPDSAGDQAKLEVSLAQFFALTGNDEEAARLSELGLGHLPPDHSSYIDAAVSQAAIAVRRDDPKAVEYIKRLETIEKSRHKESFAYLRWAQDMRKGIWSDNSFYFNYETGSQESVDAILRGSGKDVLAHCPRQELVDLIILAGRRVKTDREGLIDAIRYYDPGCLDKRCPLEYLAHQASMRAVALRELRPGEVGREADLQALEERARKLRERLLHREFAVTLHMIEKY